MRRRQPKNSSLLLTPSTVKAAAQSVKRRHLGNRSCRLYRWANKCRSNVLAQKAARRVFVFIRPMKTEKRIFIVFGRMKTKKRRIFVFIRPITNRDMCFGLEAAKIRRERFAFGTNSESDVQVVHFSVVTRFFFLNSAENGPTHVENSSSRWKAYKNIQKLWRRPRAAATPTATAQITVKIRRNLFFFFQQQLDLVEL